MKNRRVRVVKARAVAVDNRVIELRKLLEEKEGEIKELADRVISANRKIRHIKDRDKKLYQIISEQKNKLGDLRRQVSHMQNQRRESPEYSRSTYRQGYAARLEFMKEYAKKHRK